MIRGLAPVVKWISHQSSELTFQVRVLAGAQESEAQLVLAGALRREAGWHAFSAENDR